MLGPAAKLGPKLVLLAALLLCTAAPSLALDDKGGRRTLLSRPDGRQPWRNTPPGNMTVVIHFNQLGQLAVRQTSTGLQLAAKFLAMVAGAQRSAVQRYPRQPALQIAAAAYAGHGVLTRLFPLQSATFDAVMRTYTDGLTNVQRAIVARTAQQLAQRIVADSLTDGLSSWADWYYPPDGTEGPGQYQFTSPTQTFALLPQLARTRPLVIPGPERFDRGGPFALGSANFTAELEEVRTQGGDGLAPPDNVQTAQFWFNGPNTASSAGQWSDIAMSLFPQNTTAFEAADLLYRLNAAMFDASVVCWHAKYKYNFWRPITALRFQGNQGWSPVLPTPQHPEHPSGHSCAGGAAGQILTNYFGTAAVTFTAGSEWPTWQNPILPKRTYASFWEAVQEGMDSRVFAGVHFRRAVNVGKDIGMAVAQFVWNAGPPAATVDD